MCVCWRDRVFPTDQSVRESYYYPFRYSTRSSRPDWVFAVSWFLIPIPGFVRFLSPLPGVSSLFFLPRDPKLSRSSHLSGRRFPLRPVPHRARRAATRPLHPVPSPRRTDRGPERAPPSTAIAWPKGTLPTPLVYGLIRASPGDLSPLSSTNSALYLLLHLRQITLFTSRYHRCIFDKSPFSLTRITVLSGILILQRSSLF